MTSSETEAGPPATVVRCTPRSVRACVVAGDGVAAGESRIGRASEDASPDVTSPSAIASCLPLATKTSGAPPGAAARATFAATA